MNYWRAKIIVIFLLLLGTLSSYAQYGEDTATSVIEEVTQDSVTAGDYTHSGDPEKTKFLKKEDYPGLSVQERKVPDSLVKQAQQDKSFWYANAVIEKEKPAEENTADGSYIPVSQRSWFQTLIWFIIIGGFATLLMIYLSSNNIGLFRKKKVLNDVREEGEEVTEDIFAINYQREIDKATAQGNYRLGVRLMFLRLLKNMSEKNIIRYQQDKTNFDYLMQLHGTSYYPHFFRITRNYEYSWYGKFDISEPNYQLIRKDFDHFETGLR